MCVEDYVFVYECVCVAVWKFNIPNNHFFTFLTFRQLGEGWISDD